MLDLIKVFIKVTESGSFSKAGVALNMAPSSITRKIDALEQLTQRALFKRSTRQLVLTDAGHLLLKDAYPLIHQSELLLANLSQQDAEPQGILSVSVFESFGRFFINPLLGQFYQQYPKIKLHIEFDNRVVDLNAEAIDLAIRIGKPVDSSLKARRLLTNETQVLASPVYLEQAEDINSPEQLSAHNCLLLNRNRQQTWWHFTQPNKHEKVQVSGSLCSTGAGPILAAALAGVGVIQLPHWITAKYQKQKRLVPILTQWQSALSAQGSGEIYACYANSPFIKPELRVFIDFLVANVAPPSSLTTS